MWQQNLHPATCSGAIKPALGGLWARRESRAFLEKHLAQGRGGSDGSLTIPNPLLSKFCSLLVHTQPKWMTYVRDRYVACMLGEGK